MSGRPPCVYRGEFRHLVDSVSERFIERALSGRPHLGYLSMYLDEAGFEVYKGLLSGWDLEGNFTPPRYPCPDPRCCGCILGFKYEGSFLMLVSCTADYIVLQSRLTSLTTGGPAVLCWQTLAVGELPVQGARLIRPRRLRCRSTENESCVCGRIQTVIRAEANGVVLRPLWRADMINIVPGGKFCRACCRPASA